MGPHELQHGALREFGRSTETAMVAIYLLGQRLGDGGNHPGWGNVTGPGLRHFVDRIHDASGVELHLVLLGPVDPVDMFEQVGEARAPEPGARRDVGSALKRLAGRGAEHGEWPATLFAHQGKRGLIDRIEIGPLFPVHLDVDEQPVHHRSRLGVLKTFMGHHMAPMAGRITNREQDRFLRLAGL